MEYEKLLKMSKKQMWNELEGKEVKCHTIKTKETQWFIVQDIKNNKVYFLDQICDKSKVNQYFNRKEYIVESIKNKTINKLCETCDTKNRIHLCNGRRGSFKYCYRSVGNLEKAKKSITPFNDINGLYNKINKNDVFDVKEDSLSMEFYGEHMNVLFGIFKHDNQKHPIGFVIV